MVKHSRRYSAVAEKVDFEKTYEPKEAMELLKEVSTAKFDETVELHIRTNVDPRHADQMIRGVCSLPHGLGKTMRVLVFAGAEGAEEARAAGEIETKEQALEMAADALNDPAEQPAAGNRPNGPD